MCSALSRLLKFALRDVLDVSGHGDPGVHSFLVDRDRGRWKARVGEGAHRDGDELLCAVLDVEHSRAARRTERERHLSAFVADANELRALTPDVHGFLGKSCLSGEDAAGSALTRVAVAHGNANGLAGDVGSKLATAAGCGAGSHHRIGGLWLPPLHRRIRPSPYC